MKKYIVMTLLFLLLVLTACQTSNDNVIDDPVDITDSKDEDKDMNDNRCQLNNQITLNQTETLTASILWEHSDVCSNLVYEDQYIQLDDYQEQGILETQSFYLSSFTELVPSWNILIDEFSNVSILISVGNDQGFSKYFSMALWKESYKSSFSSQEDEYARISIDTLIAKKNDINQVKFKIIFNKSQTDQTKLKNLSITTVLSNTLPDFNTSSLNTYSINVPSQQQLSIPNIGNLICSPTSLSMILNYYDYSLSPENVASAIYDKGAKLYGNWSFNTSYAGGFDLYSRVEYSNSLSTLMNYIEQDIPIVLSISTSHKDLLHGSIMAYPSGHLIVLKGFIYQNNNWYALVNDPAEYSDALVERQYLLNELLDAWRGYIYVVQKEAF
ncbi:MAG: C39 family peptidase [Acholeplasmataceae bacterium]|nr:C39 family peptidase [Acholeplasmataceae bacterium]